MRNYQVPVSLDDPKKAFIWDLDVFFLAILGIGVGIVSKQMVLSVMFSFFLAWRWSKLKSGKHQWYFLYVIYWFLPISDKSCGKRIPQTNQREFYR